MIECAYFGFQCSRKQWDQVKQGRQQFGKRLSPQRCCPTPPPPFPSRERQEQTIMHFKRLWQRLIVSGWATCPLAPTTAILIASPLERFPFVCAPHLHSACAVVQTRLSSNYLCGRCSVGDASCNDNQERKRQMARGDESGREWRRERFKALLKPNASQWWWWACMASTAVVVCRKWLFCYYVRRRVFATAPRRLLYPVNVSQVEYFI